MDLLILRDLLDELHDAVGASQARWESELFSIEASLATAWEPAIKVSRAVTRLQCLEVIFILASC